MSAHQARCELCFLEIPGFLSESECEHFKSLARESGLEASLVGFDESGYREEIKDVLKKAGKTMSQFLVNQPCTSTDRLCLKYSCYPVVFVKTTTRLMFSRKSELRPPYTGIRRRLPRVGPK